MKSLSSPPGSGLVKLSATLAHETDFAEVFFITNVRPPSQLFLPANAFPNSIALPFTLAETIVTGSSVRESLLTTLFLGGIASAEVVQVVRMTIARRQGERLCRVIMLYLRLRIQDRIIRRVAR